jgi:hypothetical protein
VLGVFKRPHVTLPTISIPSPSDGMPWLLGVAALALLALSGGAILAYVLNFVRRSNA